MHIIFISISTYWDVQWAADKIYKSFIKLPQQIGSLWASYFPTMAAVQGKFPWLACSTLVSLPQAVFEEQLTLNLAWTPYLIFTWKRTYCTGFYVVHELGNVQKIRVKTTQ